jgi:hypothetical protein
LCRIPQTEAIVAKPASPDFIAHQMPLSCQAVIALEPVYPAQDLFTVGLPETTEGWKEILLLILCVLRGGIAKVLEGYFQCPAVLGAQTPAALFVRNGVQGFKKTIDALMAVQQQPDRVGELAWTGSDYYRHLLGFPDSEVIGVDLLEAVPMLREIIQAEDRGNRANRYTGAAIDTFHRIDVELCFGFEHRFGSFRMDTVDWARINTRRVFHADARFGDDVGHWSSLSESSLEVTAAHGNDLSHCH